MDLLPAKRSPRIGVADDVVYENVGPIKKKRIAIQQLTDLYEEMGGIQGLKDLASTGVAGQMFVYNLIFKHALEKEGIERDNTIKDIPWLTRDRLEYKRSRQDPSDLSAPADAVMVERNDG